MAKSVSQSIPDDLGMQGDFLYFIFFFFFLFHKALRLWLYILAISTLPPATFWPLSLCNQREKYALTVNGTISWKLQVKYLWAYSHVPWFNSINCLALERLILILLFHTRSEMTKGLKQLYEAGNRGIIYKVLMLWQKHERTQFKLIAVYVQCCVWNRTAFSCIFLLCDFNLGWVCSLPL